MFGLRTLFKASIVLGLSVPMAAHAGPFARAAQPPASTVQQLSQPTVAPQGFLAFCKRNPEECGPAISSPEPAEPSEIAAAVSARIDRLADFGRTGGLTVTAADRMAPLSDWSVSNPSWRATNPYVSARSEMFVPVTKTRRVVAVKDAVRIDITNAISDLQKLRLAPAADVAAAPDRPLLLASELWTEIDIINRRVNRAIVYRSDAAEHGASEVWSLPLAEGRNTGDCEDYVLEKRHALLAAGVPMRALSIAVVRTLRGETHAVLLLDTDQGEYVLDSLSNKIQPWTKAGYEWRERQVAGSTNSWAMVADPRNQAPSRIRKPAILLAALN